MKFKSYKELEKARYTRYDGPLYRIDTMVFTNRIDDSGETHCEDAEYWVNDEGLGISEFDCFITDLDEARAYAESFTRDMARWHKRNGNGPKFDHVAVEVLSMDWCDGSWEPGYAVSTYDWMWGETLEVWHDLDISDERACRI